MVKNNVQLSAETDLHNAVVLNALDIVTAMVKNNRAGINEIPGLVDQIVQGFSNSAAINGINLPFAAAVVESAPVAAPVAQDKQKGRKKRDLSGPAYDAMVARMAKARAVRGSVKSTKPAEPVAEASAQAVIAVAPEQTVLRRGPGRPRKVAQAKPEPLTHAKVEDEQREYDLAFRRRNPAKCTVEQSLQDTGDRKMTCLVDGKRVSFLETHLLRNYGMTFKDYSRIYDLPADYPTTPPEFKANKRADALKLGLGTQEMREGKKKAQRRRIASKRHVEEIGSTEVTPVVARPSGRSRRTTVVDVNAIATAA